jgi:hypothetical protein
VVVAGGPVEVVGGGTDVVVVVAWPVAGGHWPVDGAVVEDDVKGMVEVVVVG